MDRAGKATAQFIQETFPDARSVFILCGNGNNGGDGFVVADVLSDSMDVHVLLLHGLPKTDEAKHAYAKLDPSLFVEDISPA